MAESVKTDTPRIHPDEIAKEIKQMLRENGFVLDKLIFCSKRGGTHEYG